MVSKLIKSVKQKNNFTLCTKLKLNWKVTVSLYTNTNKHCKQKSTSSGFIPGYFNHVLQISGLKTLTERNHRLLSFNANKISPKTQLTYSRQVCFLKTYIYFPLWRPLKLLGWYEFIYDDKNADMLFFFIFFLREGYEWGNLWFIMESQPCEKTTW